MTPDTSAYVAALAALGWPDWLAWTVQVNPRRKTTAVDIQPGGAVTFVVPASGSPAALAEVIRRHRTRIVAEARDKRDRGVRLTTKDLVTGETFPLLGRPYRLRLVDADGTSGRCADLLTAHPGVPIVAEPGPSTWSGTRTWQLTLRRDRATAATVIGWYRAELVAWLDDLVPPLAARHRVASGLTWKVRPYRRRVASRSWATYHTSSHTIYVEWLVAQFPAELAQHVVHHELAHATRPGGPAHGPLWQRAMDRICPPGWRSREKAVRTLDGLPLWEGATSHHQPTSTPTAALWTALSNEVRS